MCKARNCQYYKMCLAKYDCADFMCADYKAKPKKEKREAKNDKTENLLDSVQ